MEQIFFNNCIVLKEVIKLTTQTYPTITQQTQNAFPMKSNSRKALKSSFQGVFWSKFTATVRHKAQYPL